MAHTAKVKARLFPEGARSARWARGNGDNVFKAMALTSTDQIDKIAKANKLDKRLGTDAPNAGRRSTKLANMLRKVVTDGGVAKIGKHEVSSLDKRHKGLDDAFNGAVERAEASKRPAKPVATKTQGAGRSTTKDSTITAGRQRASNTTKQKVKKAG